MPGRSIVLGVLLLSPGLVGTPLLSRYAASPDRAVRLPRELREVSGLAWTTDGRLLAHNDEVAILYELDPTTGAIRRQWPLGQPAPRGDFEALAVTDGGLALAASDGTVFDLALTPNGAPSIRGTIRTGVDRSCDVEGLAAHADTLFLVCKQPSGKHIVIHRRRRVDGAPLGAPIRIPLAALAKASSLNPSELTRDTRSGHFLMLAARQRMLFELDAAGQPVERRRLATGHRQSEGLALGPDGTLYIADEGGTLALYRPRPLP